MPDDRFCFLDAIGPSRSAQAVQASTDDEAMAFAGLLAHAFVLRVFRETDEIGVVRKAI